MEDRYTIFKNDEVVINRNQTHGGLELTFKRKPSEETRQALKDSGFRWSPQQKFWYAKEEGAALETVERIWYQKKLDKNERTQYSVNKGKFSSSHQTAEQGGPDESDKSAGDKTGQGQKPQRNVFGRSAESNVREHGERNNTAMGGAAGAGHSGARHGNAVQQSERQGVPSDDNTVSGGRLSGAVQTHDSDADVRVRGGGVREGEVEHDLSEHNSGAQQPRHGHELSRQSEIFFSGKTFEGRYSYDRQRFEMLFKRKLNPQYMELLKYYGYKWDKEAGLFTAEAGDMPKKGMEMITESELALDAGVDPLDLAELREPRSDAAVPETTRTDSEILMAAFAPAEALAEAKSSEIIVSDFAEKDFRAPPTYRGIYRKDGYAYAGDGHACAKIRESYPESLEGKVTESASNNIVGNRWIDVSKFMPENNPEWERTDEVGSLDKYLARAMAAEALDEGKGALVQFGSTWLPAKELKKALLLARQAGFNRVRQAPNREGLEGPRISALVFFRDKDDSFVAVSPGNIANSRDSAILVDKDGVFHNYESNEKAAKAILGEKGYAENFARRLSKTDSPDIHSVFMANLAAARETMAKNGGKEFPADERDCEFLAAMTVLAKSLSEKPGKDGKPLSKDAKSRIMRRIWEKQDMLMHAFDNPSFVLDEKRRAELVADIEKAAEQDFREEHRTDFTDRNAVIAQGPSIFDTKEFKKLSEDFPGNPDLKRIFKTRFLNPELPGGKRLKLSESDRLEWAYVMAKKDVENAPKKEPETTFESKDGSAGWKATVKTDGKTTVVELGENGDIVDSEQMMAHVMSAIMKSAIKKNLRMMNPAWGEKQIDDEYRAAVEEDGEENAFRLSLKSMQNLSAMRMKTAAALAGSDALEAAKTLMPEDQFEDAQRTLAAEQSKEISAGFQRVKFLSSALSRNAGGASVSEDTGMHDKGFLRYEADGSEMYVCELSGTKALAYAIEDGAKPGFVEIELSDILSRKGCRLDLECDPYMPLEAAVHERHPGLFQKEAAEHEAKMPKRITRDNVSELGVKEGSVLRDSNGNLWKITNASEMARMVPLDDSQNLTAKSVYSGGIKTLLGLSYENGTAYEIFPDSGEKPDGKSASAENPLELAAEAAEQTDSGIQSTVDSALAETKIPDLYPYIEAADEAQKRSSDLYKKLDEKRNREKELVDLDPDKAKAKKDLEKAEIEWSAASAESNGKHHALKDAEKRHAEAMHSLISRLENAFLGADSEELNARYEKLEKKLPNIAKFNSLDAHATDIAQKLAIEAAMMKKDRMWLLEKEIAHTKWHSSEGVKELAKICRQKNPDAESIEEPLRSALAHGHSSPDEFSATTSEAGITISLKDYGNVERKANFTWEQAGEVFKRLAKNGTFDQAAEREPAAAQRANGSGGQTEAERLRRQAKQILSDHTDAEILASPEMLSALAQYEGGGGVSKENGRTENEVLNAFYTPREVVSAAWKLADLYAPDSRRVLEPSSGIGRFAEGRDDKEFTLREIDKTSARIARLLHPNAEVIQGAFESQFFDKDGVARLKDYEPPKYDLVIGNPPYGKFLSEWKGKGEGEAHSRYEEYFMEKALDSLENESGAVVFVVPSGWLRSGRDNAKDIIASKGKLVDAYRLPNGAFGSTDIGTDIIVLKKLSYGERMSVRAVMEADAKGVENDKMPKSDLAAARSIIEAVSGDSFFRSHPEKIIGKEGMRSGRFGPEPYVSLPEGKSLEDALAELSNSLEEKISAHVGERAAEIKSVAVEERNDEAAENEKTESQADRALADAIRIEAEREADLKAMAMFDASFLESGDIPKISDYTWRRNNIFDKRFVLETKTMYLTVNTANGIKVAAIGRPDGRIESLVDESSPAFRVLTKKRKDDLTEKTGETLEKYMREAALMLDRTEKGALFLGLTEPKLYYGTNMYSLQEGGLADLVCIRTVPVDLPEDDFAEAYEGKRMYNEKDKENQMLFARIGDDLSTSMGQAIEDDSVVRLDSDEIEIPEYRDIDDFFAELGIPNDRKFDNWDRAWKLKEKHDQQREELAKKRWESAEQRRAQMSGFASGEEYRAHLKETIKRKFDAQKAASEEWLERKAAYEDADILLSAIKNARMGLGETTLLEGREVSCSQGKERKDDREYIVDGELAFRVNSKEKTVAAFNGFPLSPAYLKSLKDEWGEWPAVSDIAIEKTRISLSDILAEKKIPAQKTLEGKKAAELFMKHAKIDCGYSAESFSAEYETEGKNAYEAVVESGTVKRLFLKGQNYELCSYDSMSSTLTIRQGAYENGLVLGIEDAFRKKFEDKDLTVVKDITVDGRRYMDTDGATCCVPAAEERYRPQKERILTAAEFAKLYGKELDENQKAFMSATDRKGFVQEWKLSLQQKTALDASPDYTKTKDGYIHKERYASGDIYRKLEELENDYKAALETKESYERNRKLLESAIPKRIPLSDINISVISPFAQDLELGGKNAVSLFFEWATGASLEDSPNTLQEITDFTLSGISREDIPPSIEWADIMMYARGEALPPLRDESLPEDMKAQIRNEKIDARKSAAETLWRRFVETGLDQAQKKEFEDKYNRRFNAFRNPDYSKLPLFISGMNLFRKGKEFRLYAQQVKGVAQAADKGNGIVAYPVGLGKTATGIVTAETQLQTGRAKRPFVIVPKSVLGKWESDMHELFPNRPVINLGNFSKEDTGAYYSKEDHSLNLPDGAVVLATRDALNNIHWDRKTIDKYLFDDYADLLSLNDKLEDKNARTRAEARKKIYSVAEGTNKVRDEYYVDWASCGFDMLLVDEAHAFKNLFKVPRPKNQKRRDNMEKRRPGEKAPLSANEFAGLGQGDPSKRALKMFNMTQIIQKQNEDRNVFMLTATPFTNSPLEVYTMLSYVARKELEEAGIKDLYQFCAQFAKTRYEPVVKANGVEYGNVMKEFADLQGLQGILRRYIDKVDYEEAKVIRPVLKTHKIFLEPTPLQKEIFEFATNVVMEYQPKEGEKRAPVLEAISLMKTAALSPALVKPSALVDPNTKQRSIQVPPPEKVVECSPKLQLVCDTIVKNWNAHPDCGQIMYMPEGTDTFQYVIEYMKKQGVPESVFMTIDGQSEKIGGKQIKMSKDDDTDDKRQKAADIFNDAKSPAKILIGSQAICEGMDLNGNTIALYNCQLGWNPSEMTQLNGRIQRPGNLQGHCHAVVPLVADSSDPAFFQKHDEKSHRFFDLFNYSGKSMDVEDINPESLKYELIKDPYKLARLDQRQEGAAIEREIGTLKSRANDFSKLVENRLVFKNKIKDREQDKNDYITRHKESLAEGRPNRGEAEQADGEARFDKSIAGLKKQLGNIEKRMASLGVTDMESQSEFVDSIGRQIKAKEAELSASQSPERMQDLIDKHKRLVAEQRETWKREADETPLYKRIQDDMVPMHVVERNVMRGRYEEAMREADGDAFRQKEIEESWKAYEDGYRKKWGAEDERLAAEKTKEEAEKPAAEADESIVRIIDHQIEEIEWKRSSAAPQDSLFPMTDEPENVRHAKNSPSIDWNNSTVDNFSDNLKAVFDNPAQELTTEAVLKVTRKLIQKMSKSEQQRFVKITNQLGIVNKKNMKAADEFFVKIAKGELRLTPGKKPPVVKLKPKDYEYDIF